MRNIILVGYMCVGKTTIGKALAQRMGLSFYDLDWYVEGRRRQRISEIFEKVGEEGFRNIERNMLHEVAEFEDIVLSCGGGTPCFFDNMDYLNQKGTTLYLKASPEIIVAHYKMSRTVRPLLKDKSEEELHEFVGKQLAERSPYYEKASHIIDVDILDTADRVDQLVDLIIRTATP